MRNLPPHLKSVPLNFYNHLSAATLLSSESAPIQVAIETVR